MKQREFKNLFLLKTELTVFSCFNCSKAANYRLKSHLQYHHTAKHAMESNGVLQDKIQSMWDNEVSVITTILQPYILRKSFDGPVLNPAVSLSAVQEQ